MTLARPSRSIRSLFAWRLSHEEGVWRYEENMVTGRRRAVRRYADGYSPIDHGWLNHGGLAKAICAGRSWRTAPPCLPMNVIPPRLNVPPGCPPPAKK